MTEIYKAHRIEVRSRPSTAGDWRTEVRVWSSTATRIMRAKLPPPPSAWTAATKQKPTDMVSRTGELDRPVRLNAYFGDRVQPDRRIVITPVGRS